MGWNRTFCFEFIGKSMETETTTRLEFGKAIIEETLWESQSGIRVGKIPIWVRSSEIRKLWQSSPVYQFHQNKLASPCDEC